MRFLSALVLVPTIATIATSQTRIELINQPMQEGIVIEDGVAGYAFLYDVYIPSGGAGGFQVGGDRGPLGDGGTFMGSDSAWYRVPASDPSYAGMWQVWYSSSVSMSWAALYNDPAAIGILPADTWDAGGTHHNGSSGIGPLFTPGAPIPWARDNIWHKPSEYGSTTEYFFPGVGFGAQASGDEGLAYHAVTGIFVGGPLELQATMRVVAPYEPGSINWYIDAPVSGTVEGPGGPAVFHLDEDVQSISVAAGGQQKLDFYAPRSFAGNFYLMLGSQTGTSPGIPVDNVIIPLNFDVYTQFTLQQPNSPPYGNGFGQLDADANAKMSVTVGAGQAPPSFIGFQVHHACVVIDISSGSPTVTAASNPVSLDFTL